MGVNKPDVSSETLTFPYFNRGNGHAKGENVQSAGKVIALIVGRISLISRSDDDERVKKKGTISLSKEHLRTSARYFR